MQDTYPNDPVIRSRLLFLFATNIKYSMNYQCNCEDCVSFCHLLKFDKEFQKKKQIFPKQNGDQELGKVLSLLPTLSVRQI
jgi:hypothetical protein